MKEEGKLLPNLFRSEYQKIVSVLCHLFGIDHIEIAEDIASDTFLAAMEDWALKGIPPNPTAWLYTVAKNKTRNYLKRHALFEQKLSPVLRQELSGAEETGIDLSLQHIADSQLAMIFAVCHPCIPSESQIAIALNLLCGFGIQEISDAFLTNRDVIYKRIQRARQRLQEEKIPIRPPLREEIGPRLPGVLMTIYLLFSEGYYSVSQDIKLRKDFCAEAMRLCFLLLDNPLTDLPPVNALMALMCFHASRFDARIAENGSMILYEDQDERLWNQELIEKGGIYLGRASTGTEVSKYHLEAAIAYWHTKKEDSAEKWENILQLYNRLLIMEYSPVAALNRTYALAKANGKEQAIKEALKLGLEGNHFYYSLLGNLYTGVDDRKAIAFYEQALTVAPSEAEREVMKRHIGRLQTR